MSEKLNREQQLTEDGWEDAKQRMINEGCSLKQLYLAGVIVGTEVARSILIPTYPSDTPETDDNDNQ